MNEFFRVAAFRAAASTRHKIIPLTNIAVPLSSTATTPSLRMLSGPERVTWRFPRVAFC